MNDKMKRSLSHAFDIFSVRLLELMVSITVGAPKKLFEIISLH